MCVHGFAEVPNLYKGNLNKILIWLKAPKNGAF